MRFTGRVYRAHNPRWSFKPLSGAGAGLFGARFHRKGRDALYTSLRPETAWMEAQQAFTAKAQPLTICGYDVDCEDVADLTDLAEQNRLSIGSAELSCAWEDLFSRGLVPPTWTLSERLIRDGAAGAIVPSFAPGARKADINLVLWRWSSTRPHLVAVIDDYDRLPRDDLSWR